MLIVSLLSLSLCIGLLLRRRTYYVLVRRGRRRRRTCSISFIPSFPPSFAGRHPYHRVNTNRGIDPGQPVVTPPRGLPPGVIWDKSCVQQASCLLNKPSARHVLMGLHCPINLKFFLLPNGVAPLAMPRRWRTVHKNQQAEKIP
jgi:hypothetical protein